MKMKKTALKKKSSDSIAKIQIKLWAECKRIIREKYGNVCYTCGKAGLEGANWHTGHMLAKASLGAMGKYNLRLLRPQCYFCNINCGGQGAIFIENMRSIEGDKYVDDLLMEIQEYKKPSDYYPILLEEYKKL